MRYVIVLISLLTLSGCATIGDYEFVNELPHGESIGKKSRALKKIWVRTSKGYSNDNFNAQMTNRGLGQVEETIKTYNGGFDFEQIPSLLRDLQLIKAYGRTVIND